MALKPLFGADWRREADDPEMMYDELGHRRRISKVPCFLGGSWHILTRDLGEDVRHTVTVQIRVCLYCGREMYRRVRKVTLVHDLLPSGACSCGEPGWMSRLSCGCWSWSHGRPPVGSYCTCSVALAHQTSYKVLAVTKGPPAAKGRPS